MDGFNVKRRLLEAEVQPREDGVNPHGLYDDFILVFLKNAPASFQTKRQRGYLDAIFCRRHLHLTCILRRICV